MKFIELAKQTAQELGFPQESIDLAMQDVIRAMPGISAKEIEPHMVESRKLYIAATLAFAVERPENLEFLSAIADARSALRAKSN